MPAKIPQSTNAAASEILKAVAAVPQTAGELRAIRRRYSAQLARTSPEELLAIANRIVREGDDSARFVAYELVQSHRAASGALRKAGVVELGHGLHSWQSVDTFAYCISGPAWKR